MKAGGSMRRNFAQILKDAKIDIKVEYQKLYGMLYDRSIQVSNANRISVYDELSTYFIAFLCLKKQTLRSCRANIAYLEPRSLNGHCVVC